jgi:hypothetical protein
MLPMGRIRLDEPPVVGRTVPIKLRLRVRRPVLPHPHQYESPIVARTKVLDTRSGQGDIWVRIRAKHWGIASTPRLGLGVLALGRQGE